MDIVKLLSRATKPTGKLSGASAQGKLPSAGPTSNPQLYHDPIPAPKGKKRKLGSVTEKQRGSSPVDEDFNFFAPKENKTKSIQNLMVEEVVTEQEKMAADKEGVKADKKTFDLEESQCRQILRSHRLKVTQLSSQDLGNATSNKRKKSSRKKKTPDAAEGKIKEDLKQLYPQPLLDIGELHSIYGISKRLRQNLAKEGYKVPTEVQMGSLPLLLRPEIALSNSMNGGKNDFGSAALNLLAVAPTGSGKTLAFLIPILNSVSQRRRETKLQANHRLEAIVIAPTRELASQIVNEGRKLSLGTGVQVVMMQKGMKLSDTGNEIDGDSDSMVDEEDDEEEEKGGEINLENVSKEQSQRTMVKADVLVTTPLALLNALSSARMNTKMTLPTVRHLVLDEADVLLDDLFREQTLGVWGACINTDLRVTLWSATMGSNIEVLASSIILSRYKRLNIQTAAPIIRLVVGLKDSAIPNISHNLIYTATEPGKLLALRQILHSRSSSSIRLRPPFLIFTQTIPRAVALHSELLYDITPLAGGSSRIAVLHSDLSATMRSAVMSRFRAGEIWILITTDLLSRGVDFRGINGVVNYDIPNSAAAYVHRVGRTGRAGRDGGVAITFYTKEDIGYVKGIANVIAASEKQAGRSEEEIRNKAATDAKGNSVPGGSGLPKWLLDALPTPSKNTKKNLKKHGMEARRTGLAGKERAKNAMDRSKKSKSGMQISTKSGFERRLENRKRGAIEGSKRRKLAENSERGDLETSDWSGFDD